MVLVETDMVEMDIVVFIVGNGPIIGDGCIVGNGRVVGNSCIVGSGRVVGNGCILGRGHTVRHGCILGHGHIESSYCIVTPNCIVTHNFSILTIVRVRGLGDTEIEFHCSSIPR